MRGALPRARSARTAAVCAGLLAMSRRASLVAHPSSPPSSEDRGLGAGYRTRRARKLRHPMGPRRRARRQDRPSAARLEAEQRLASRVPGLHDRTRRGVAPSEDGHDDRPGRPPLGQGPANAVVGRAQLPRREPRPLRPDAADLAGLDLVYSSTPEPGEVGATIVRFAQKVGGVPVFGAEIAVVMSPRDHAVAGTSGVVYPRRRRRRRDQDRGALDARRARRAATDLSTASQVSARTSPAPTSSTTGLDDAGYTLLRVRAGPRRARRARSSATGCAPSRWSSPSRPARRSRPTTSRSTSRASPRAPARTTRSSSAPWTARVLFRNNLTCDGHVHVPRLRRSGDAVPAARQPAGHGRDAAPDGHSGPVPGAALRRRPTSRSRACSARPTRGSRRTTSVTTGNNVDAYLDIAGPTASPNGDLRGARTSRASSSTPSTRRLRPPTSTIRHSKTTHLFFFNNWLHDIWYQKGFDEVSRNAQTNNYGRGGAGSDSVKAEGEDRVGTNNANMYTPADGGRPRMQMYRFTGGGISNPQRDASHDCGIVAHEWMHYMSNRLVGNGSGLSTTTRAARWARAGATGTAVTQIVHAGDDLDGCFAHGRVAAAVSCSRTTTSTTTTSASAATRTRRARTGAAHVQGHRPGPRLPGGVPRNTIRSTARREVHNAGEIWARCCGSARPR